MSTTIQEIENSLTGMLHGASLKKVRNKYHVYKRVADIVLARLDPIETVREQQLDQIVHDDLTRYSLPSDYKKIIGLAPQDDRQSSDRARRRYLEGFEAELAFRNKEIAIEAGEGTKFLRINWKSSSAKTLHTMNSLTDDGDITVEGTASGLRINEQYKLSGSASIEVDLAATDDGIYVLNKDTNVDLEDWDELADFIVPVYFGAVTNFNSASFVFGNDLTSAFWTCLVETKQSDGTAVKVGWNYFLFNWVGATETGTVDPALIDSFKITFHIDAAIADVRIDNIRVSLGRFFDLKYYSQYGFLNTAGIWLSLPTSVDDSVIFTGTSLQIFQMECLKAMAQQIEGSHSAFDMAFAENELSGIASTPYGLKAKTGLYQIYRAEHPSESIKQIGNWWCKPRFKR